MEKRSSVKGAKLTAGEIEAIKGAKGTLKEIASEFGLSVGTVQKYRARRKYAKRLAAATIRAQAPAAMAKVGLTLKPNHSKAIANAIIAVLAQPVVSAADRDLVYVLLGAM